MRVTPLGEYRTGKGYLFMNLDNNSEGKSFFMYTYTHLTPEREKELKDKINLFAAKGEDCYIDAACVAIFERAGYYLFIVNVCSIDEGKLMPFFLNSQDFKPRQHKPPKKLEDVADMEALEKTLVPEVKTDE